MSIKQKLHRLFVELFIAPKEQKSRSYHDLAPKIAPLVDALNSLESVTTIASCQGHVNRLSMPYVYFHRSTQQAALIAKRLKELWEKHQLHVRWKLTGQFSTSQILCFHLSAVLYDQSYSQFLLWRCWHYGLYRHYIDQDVNVLGQQLGEIR